MKTETEVIEKIIGIGKKYKSIRAILITSSRANKNNTDILSDYDIIYFVENINEFIKQKDWILEYGNILTYYYDQSEEFNLLQYTRLIIFEDYTKIDFSICSVEKLYQLSRFEKLPEYLNIGYKVLLDKDDQLKELKLPSYNAYIPQKPTKEEYHKLINNFWWETTYVAKNLWRDELYFAKYNVDYVIRFDILQKMIEWYLEITNNWNLSTGVKGRGFKTSLDPELWNELEKTYTGANIEDNWESLFLLVVFFRKIAKRVGDNLSYKYSDELDNKMMKYLNFIKNLKK